MMRASAPKGASGTTPRASPSSHPTAPPPWNRDGREMRSLPSVRSQSASSFTAAATAAAAAAAAADGAAATGGGGRRGSASSRGSTHTCASSAASGTASRRGLLRRRPSARSGDGGGGGGTAASAAPPVWTCLRMRPCVGTETPSPQVTADAVSRCVVGSAKGAPTHGASCVFGPAAPQAEVNEALCLELVPLLFGGGGGVVVASGAARTGKTAALFGSPADTPDPFGAEGGGGGEEGGGGAAEALPPSHPGTHRGGVVPALLSDVLRRVADLPVYDCAVTLSFLALPAAAAAAASASAGELVDLLSTSPVVAAAAGAASSPDVVSSAAPAVREALPHAGPSLHGHVECAVETPHDFAALWAQARRRGQEVAAAATEQPVVVCCVSLTRVDSRNGATSQGQLMFVDLPASGHASSAAAVSKVLAAVDAGEGCGGGDGFVPWRDSRLTRLLQCAFTPASPSPLAHAPRFFLLGTLAPTAELAADALATAGFVGQFHRAGGGGGSSGASELEHATDVARRLQRRLDRLSLAHPAALQAAVDSADVLRRDKAHLERQLAAARAEAAAAAAAAAAAVPAPVVAAATAPVSTKPPPIANVLHILARYKVVRPEIGHGTAAVVGQLVSQLAARERVLSAAAPRQSDVRCLPSDTWGALLRELAAAEPSCVPTADPRSSHQPAHLCQDRAGFQEWWSAAAAAATPTPPQQQKPQKVSAQQQQQTAASARRPAAAAATASSVAAVLPRTQQPITPAAAAAAPRPPPEVFEDAGLAGPVVSPLVIPNAVEVSPQPQPQPQPQPPSEEEVVVPTAASRSRTPPPSGHGGVSVHLQEAITSVVQALDGRAAAAAASAAATAAEAEATTPMTNTLPMSAAGGPAAAAAAAAPAEGTRRPTLSPPTSSSPPKHRAAAAVAAVAAVAAPQAAEAAAAAQSPSPAAVSPRGTPRASAGGRRYDDEGEWSLSPDNLTIGGDECEQSLERPPSSHGSPAMTQLQKFALRGIDGVLADARLAAPPPPLRPQPQRQQPSSSGRQHSAAFSAAAAVRAEVAETLKMMGQDASAAAAAAAPRTTAATAGERVPPPLGESSSSVSALRRPDQTAAASKPRFQFARPQQP